MGKKLSDYKMVGVNYSGMNFSEFVQNVYRDFPDTEVVVNYRFEVNINPSCIIASGTALIPKNKGKGKK